MRTADRVATMLALVATLATPRLLSCQNPTSADLSCRRFVQDFYDWYVPIGIADKDRLTTELLPRKSLFDQKLWQMLVADDEAQSHSDEIVGLDFDPILNSQDPSPKFVVKNASTEGRRCRAAVVGINQGVEEERVTPELVLANGHWIFVNFYYESRAAGKSTRSNLVQALRDLASDRAHLRDQKPK